MTRSFGAVDLVRLPVLGVSDAIALGTALVAWADEAGPLPARVRKSLARLRELLEELREVARERVEDRGVDASTVREFDRALDAAWSAAYSWTQGWAKLPNKPERAQRAGELNELLFADGLKFTQRAYNAQWVESQARLDLIEEHGMDRHFVELGGGDILDSIRQAHAQYGEALGLTQVKLGDDVSARERLDAFRHELKRYVLQVAAHVDPEDDATRELADYLLAPLRTWRSSSSEPARDPDEPDEGTDGEPRVTAEDLNASAATDPPAADSSIPA